MQISFSLTDNAGGVVINGDDSTLKKVERMMVNGALDSHGCTDYGVVMALSTYFEENGSQVDWITLVVGVSVLRNNVGYNLNREHHALLCTLEYLTENALKSLLPNAASEIEDVLSSLHGITDRNLTDEPITRMVYLIKLKTPENRKKYLLRILASFSLTLQFIVKDDKKLYQGLTRADISYPLSQENPYPL